MRPEKNVTLSELERTIYDLCNDAPEFLSAMRNKVDCSNKQWDLSLKHLTKNQLVSVYKENDELWIKKV